MARQNIYDEPDDDLYDDRPKKQKKKKPSKKEAADARMASYGVGLFLLVLGVAFIVGFFLIGTAPRKVFVGMSAGGAACVLSAVGMFLHPLNDDQLHDFMNNPNPLSIFKTFPVFWKVWFGGVIVVMVAVAIGTEQILVKAPPKPRLVDQIRDAK